MTGLPWNATEGVPYNSVQQLPLAFQISRARLKKLPATTVGRRTFRLLRFKIGQIRLAIAAADLVEMESDVGNRFIRQDIEQDSSPTVRASDK